MAHAPHRDSLPSTNGFGGTGVLGIEEYFNQVGVFGPLESEVLLSFKLQVLS